MTLWWVMEENVFDKEMTLGLVAAVEFDIKMWMFEHKSRLHNVTTTVCPGVKVAALLWDNCGILWNYIWTDQTRIVFYTVWNIVTIVHNT